LSEVTGDLPSEERVPVQAPGRTRSERRVLFLEGAVLLGLFFFHLFSFDIFSPVNGPYEVFAQDSVYILKALEAGSDYPWNPQSHLLYHVVVEAGHSVWKAAFGAEIEPTYRYLKVFTAACGLAFLAAMALLFRELGLRPAARIGLLLLTAVSVSAWFHFAAFETHCLAMPALALYLLTLARLRNGKQRTLADRALLIGSLALMACTRVDLFRIAAVSGVLLLLPGLRPARRALALDIALACVLALAGTTLMASAYFNQPIHAAATMAFERHDRDELEGEIRTRQNFGLTSLISVGRAISLYSVVMPVEARPAERSFTAPPSFDLRLHYFGVGAFPSTRLFSEPARHLLGNAISVAALVAAAFLFLRAFAATALRTWAGDPFHALLVAQAVFGWLFCTWLHPKEPFLWILEFLPLWIAMIADHAERSDRRHDWALAAMVAAIAIHNWFAFYVPFR